MLHYAEISAIPIWAAEICPKNIEFETHVNKVEGPAFQEKFCFQAHQWFRNVCVRPKESSKLKFKVLH